MNKSFMQLLALPIVSLTLASSAWSEELLGSPAMEGDDFPRIIGGYLVTEGEYSVFVRDCEISIFIMEEPIRDQDHLMLSLQIEYFIMGAQLIGAKDLNFDQFMVHVRKTCGETPDATLATAVSAAVEEISN
jgi:hypothetical protein